MPESVTPGVHESLLTVELEARLQELLRTGRRVEREDQQLDWVDEALVRHVSVALRRALGSLGTDLHHRSMVVGRLLEALDPSLLPGALPLPTREALTWVAPAQPGLATTPPRRPEHGLTQPSLLFNGAQDVSLVHELRRELASAHAVDAIVAFLRVAGLRLLRRELQALLTRGGRLRLVTSSYMGNTEARAVEQLVEMGAQVRMATEEQGTRLHAKAWLFRRDNGLSTAYIGSSNLSHSALTDGAEWNVRMTQQVTPSVLERFAQAFAQLWEAAGADLREAPEDRERVKRSLRRARGRAGSTDGPMLLVDVSPRPHQEQVLNALQAERSHGHWRNLVVAATGTGKTWVAAFDYARLRRSRVVRSLLFVAHRKEILQQSRDVFRMVLRDPEFGALMVDGQVPDQDQHVFASIQSLQGTRLDAAIQGQFDMVVVDEFHHAAAPTYRALLDQVQPKVLLGLTATPERSDGQSVLHWFDQRIASELRLWDALDAGLLAPFHYIGVFDPGSAETAWRRGRLQAGLLDNLYTADDLRARRVLRAVQHYIGAPGRMRALGFCVGVGHAQHMARAFSEAGLPAQAVHGKTPPEARRAALRGLRSGRLRAVFTVDLFNEGVDIPEADTVLMLRPTQSATVFLQQLGRGLRRHPNKAQLTVLDLVGHVHQDFRFDLRYQAILGGTRRQVEHAITRDFPRLPPGCSIQLEDQARDLVLRSIRQQLRSGSWTRHADDLSRLGPDTGLAEFLHHSGAPLREVFIPASARSWSALRRAAGWERRPEGPLEPRYRKAVARLLHVDDDTRLAQWSQWLAAPDAPRLAALRPRARALATMLVATMGNSRRPVAEHQDELDQLWAHRTICEELRELLDVLRDRVRHVTRPLDTAAPLCLHATYTRGELVAAYGATAKGRLRVSREGVLFVGESNTDLLFINLDKSDDAFRPSIRYADYPMGRQRFHWESQNHTHPDTPTGRRYVQGTSQVILFVRERPRDERRESMPFTCLGPARHVRHGGARPMQVEWELASPMPAWVVQQGQALGLGA